MKKYQGKHAKLNTDLINTNRALKDEKAESVMWKCTLKVKNITDRGRLKPISV